MNIFVWKRSSGEVLTCEPAENPLRALAWAPDGNQVAAVSETGALHIWTVDGLRSLEAAEVSSDKAAPAISVAWSPGGSTLALGHKGGLVSIWNFWDKRLVKARNVGTVDIVALSFSASTQTLIASDGHGAVRVLDTDNLSELAFVQGHDGWVGEVQVPVRSSGQVLAIPTPWKRNVSIVALEAD
jgi:WD40 repeat protein